MVLFAQISMTVSQYTAFSNFLYCQNSDVMFQSEFISHKHSLLMIRCLASHFSNGFFQIQLLLLKIQPFGAQHNKKKLQSDFALTAFTLLLFCLSDVNVTLRYTFILHHTQQPWSNLPHSVNKTRHKGSIEKTYETTAKVTIECHINLS